MNNLSVEWYGNGEQKLQAAKLPVKSCFAAAANCPGVPPSPCCGDKGGDHQRSNHEAVLKPLSDLKRNGSQWQAFLVVQVYVIKLQVSKSTARCALWTLRSCIHRCYQGEVLCFIGIKSPGAAGPAYNSRLTDIH